ncbi:MAG: peptide deformylase [Candidatus Komeilibacteria bacterium RIFCSPLOWO2_01_FULL_53_11]|uniref:Peptide deformylase n=1 Tax=Candidatus Komeilibacteria bacterium RIFCSPLOWO2_01_FULL_53_11 TaxID=1798552 RepID=A0A1G2BU47_9BACT|nr:MAG: peptide deformylase [Candidatus Komeilibacteria bacterium RIFCSPLOWO2_01_FULL_53_11]
MYQIVFYPTSALNEPSKKVSVFDAALKELAREMYVAMIAADGIGLAAPQIGKNIRLIIVRTPEDDGSYKAYVNPTITYASAKATGIEEGCLSLPGLFGHVPRAAKIRVQYSDIDGVKRTEKAKGVEAIVLQHEIDHIEGNLIINRDIELTKGQELLEQWKRKKR